MRKHERPAAEHTRLEALELLRTEQDLTCVPCVLCEQERGVEVPVERIVTKEREVPVDRVVEKVLQGRLAWR